MDNPVPLWTGSNYAQGKVRIAFDPAGLVWTLDTAVRTLAT